VAWGFLFLNIPGAGFATRFHVRISVRSRFSRLSSAWI